MTWRLLQSRNFLLLWLAQLISGMGGVLYLVGVMATIFARTGSALQTSGVLVATSLPAFLLGPVAGAWVDRYSRRFIMALTNVIRAGLVGILLLLLQQEALPLWGIYLVMAGLSAAAAVYHPAATAIVPALVPPQQLVSANSLLIGTGQATLAAGFLVGSFLVLSMPLGVMVLINLVTFLIAAGLTLGLRPDTSRSTALSSPSQPSLRREIVEGMGYLRQHDVARPLIMMEFLEHVPHGIWSSAILLTFANQALHGGTTAWGIMTSAYFGGQIIGACLSAWGTQSVARRPGWIIIGSAAMFGGLTLVFALSPNLAFAASVALLFGLPAAIRDVAQASLLQHAVAEDMLGRVSALRSMATSLMYMIAGVGLAALADLIAIRAIYLIGGVLYLLTALYASSRETLRRSAIGTSLPMQDSLPSQG